MATSVRCVFLGAWLFLAGLCLGSRPSVDSQVTWFYVHDIAKASEFVGETLGFPEVKGLEQHVCRIFHTAPTNYLGVCNTRTPATCGGNPEGVDKVPVTYTLVGNRTQVDSWYARLLPDNGTAVNVPEAPVLIPAYGVYAFFFYDPDTAHSLGCYRFEVQAFEDPAWPAADCAPLL